MCSSFLLQERVPHSLGGFRCGFFGFVFGFFSPSLFMEIKLNKKQVKLHVKIRGHIGLEF